MEYKKGLYALDNISLQIENGMFGLLGQNGAGKTTLMRILTTLLEPSRGEISINGIEYTKNNYQKIKTMIGYLPQEFGIYPNLTLNEALDYIGILNKIPLVRRKEIIDDLLSKVNLQNDRNKKVKYLSGGMKRRLGLAQAMMNSPQVIIIDEPTAGLDPEERIRIRNLLVDLSGNSTVILSTHIVEDIASTCKNLAILEKGKIKYNGTVKSLIEGASGKVWKCVLLDNEQLTELKRKYLVLSNVYMSNSIEVRFLCDTKPGIECTSIEPNIEDAYMLVSGGGKI